MKANFLRLHALTTACHAGVASQLMAAPCAFGIALCAYVPSPPGRPARLVFLPTMLMAVSSACVC